MIQVKSLFQLWWNVVKFELGVKVWRPGLRFVFDLFRWKFKFCCSGNQEQSWMHLHVGPFMFGFEWDLNCQN